MITIYRSNQNHLEKIDQVSYGSWINVTDPTSDEIEELQKLGIPQDFITYPLDIDERSRTEREDDGTIFIILRIPYFQGKKVDVPYTSIPLGIVLTNQFIMTICRWQNDIIQKFISNQVKGFKTNKHNRFVLLILLNTASKFLTYLREINKITETLEDQLQLSMKNKLVLELLKYQKSLVYFTTALKSNELMMERLRRSHLFRMYPEDEDLLEDVITENQQAIEMTNISSNILNSMMDTFANIISNNLNVVMKFLTSVTIILSLLAIVTGYFGMNIRFPLNLEMNPFSYLIILGVMMGLSTIVIVIFYKRDWF